MLAHSQWSIGTAIRGALVMSLSVCVCVLCLFQSHAFSNFQMSQSGPLKPAPATCFIINPFLIQNVCHAKISWKYVKELDMSECSNLNL